MSPPLFKNYVGSGSIALYAQINAQIQPNFLSSLRWLFQTFTTNMTKLYDPDIKMKLLIYRNMFCNHSNANQTGTHHRTLP